MHHKRRIRGISRGRPSLHVVRQLKAAWLWLTPGQDGHGAAAIFRQGQDLGQAPARQQPSIDSRRTATQYLSRYSNCDAEKARQAKRAPKKNSQVVPLKFPGLPNRLRLLDGAATSSCIRICGVRIQNRFENISKVNWRARISIGSRKTPFWHEVFSMKEMKVTLQ